MRERESAAEGKRGSDRESEGERGIEREREGEGEGGRGGDTEGGGEREGERCDNGVPPFTFRVSGFGFRVPPDSAVTYFNRGSTFALRRSTLDCCLGGQREERCLPRPTVSNVERPFHSPSFKFWFSDFGFRVSRFVCRASCFGLRAPGLKQRFPRILQ